MEMDLDLEITYHFYFCSGQGLNPSMYGALLAGFETVQGKYPITVAYLDLIAQLATIHLTLSRLQQICSRRL